MENEAIDDEEERHENGSVKSNGPIQLRNEERKAEEAKERAEMLGTLNEDGPNRGAWLSEPTALILLGCTAQELHTMKARMRRPGNGLIEYSRADILMLRAKRPKGVLPVPKIITAASSHNQVSNSLRGPKLNKDGSVRKPMGPKPKADSAKPELVQTVAKAFSDIDAVAAKAKKRRKLLAPKPLAVEMETILYRCKITGGRVLELALPSDLTVKDVEKICSFLKTQAD